MQTAQICNEHTRRAFGTPHAGGGGVFLTYLISLHIQQEMIYTNIIFTFSRLTPGDRVYLDGVPTICVYIYMSKHQTQGKSARGCNFQRQIFPRGLYKETPKTSSVRIQYNTGAPGAHMHQCTKIDKASMTNSMEIVPRPETIRIDKEV